MKKLIAAISIATMTLGVGLAASTLNTEMDKVSYAIGYNLGKNFKEQEIDVNQGSLDAGLTAGLNAQKSAMTEKDMKAVMENFQKEMMAKMLKKQDEEAKKNQAESDTYLAKIAKEPGVKMLEKGLYYKVIKTGTGPVPTAKDTVEVNYEGTLNDGKVFDSSYKRGEPATFRIDEVIPGWTKALVHMPVGSTWMLYIAPDLAYGKFAPPTIGPNQALTFKVDLLSIKAEKATKEAVASHKA